MYTCVHIYVCVCMDHVYFERHVCLSTAVSRYVYIHVYIKHAYCIDHFVCGNAGVSEHSSV
jgi:hypothetical protein